MPNPSHKERYGDTKVTLSSANAQSYAKQVRTLRDYLDTGIEPVTVGAEPLGNETFYLFGDNNYDEQGGWTNFTQHYVRPTFPCKYSSHAGCLPPM